MDRNLLRTAFLILSALASLPASAAFQWATWTGPSGNVSTGTFTNGESVPLTANFTGITAGVTAGTEFTSIPSIPGRPDNTNPSFQRLMTGVPGTFLAAGTVVASLDLSNMTVDSSTVLGFADLKQGGVYYKLELRDTAGSVLPLTGITVTPYNITYLGGGPTADLNSLLDTTTTLLGRLSIDNIHDANPPSPPSTYTHTGLTTYSNLPAGTRSVKLTAWFDNQEVEGIQIYVGTGVTPGVATGMLVSDSISPTSDKALPFGNVTVGTTRTETVTVTNQTAAPVIVSMGNDTLSAPFTLTNPANCSTTLAVGAACTISISYAPTTAGAGSDTFTLKFGGVEQSAISVSGTGTQYAPSTPGSGGGGAFDVVLFAVLGSLLIRKQRKRVRSDYLG